MVIVRSIKTLLIITIGVSYSAIRIRSLEKRKIIIGYKTAFDLEKSGYYYFKVHFRMHNVDKKKIEKFKSYVKMHPNIVYDDEVLGGDDFEIEIQAKDNSELRIIIQKIKIGFAAIIKEYKVMQFYKEHKYLFLPVSS